jgi:arylsulfatase A-like enzyme
VLAALAACARQRPAAEQWNVLMLVPDTVRADHVSINGYGRETTPALDALARDGTNFTQAITVAPQTWQSYSSILSGLYPPRHGVRFIFDRPMPPDLPTLGTVLHAAGYATATFDGNAFLEGMTGRAGFDTAVRADTARATQTGRHVEHVLVDQIIEWLDGQTRPFFAFVRFSGGHWPYVENRWTQQFDPCAGHDHGFNQGDSGEIVDDPGYGLALRDAEANRRTFFPPPLPEPDRRHMIAHYDAKLRLGDEFIQRVLDHLRDQGRLDHTIVVITADHGESFGEHGYRQHGPRVDEPVMRVPLVVWLPPGHPARHPGGRVDAQVRIVDIFPTVLDALGLPIPGGLDGVSLLPVIEGQPAPPLWAYGETGRDYVGVDPERFFPGIEGKHRMIRTPQWKLVYVLHPDGPEYRLYDLQNDPGELANVAAEHPETTAELAARLAPILARDDHPHPERALTAAQREELRQLGYAD